MKMYLIALLGTLFFTQTLAQPPLKLAVAGLSHGHVDWIFNRSDKKDVVLVGIYEPNKELADRYAKQYRIDRRLFYDNLDTMLDQVKPEAVSAFGAISEHVTVVRACAPRKIHVMVEKPLATTLADAKEIQSLALKNGIYVLTNFETSWYASNQYVDDLVQEGKLGELRKVVVNAGHQGPKEIGVSKEFLEILTDPLQNGAGALMDFGCYGAHLMTWLLKGETPVSVTAVVHQTKPGIYRKVDDEASVILQYPKVQCIIQGSWNWTFPRKDMEVYGNKGYAIAADATTVRQRLGEELPEVVITLNPRQDPYSDPFSFLAAVVRGRIKLDDNDLYRLPINVKTVEILEAAKESAKENKTIFLK